MAKILEEEIRQIMQNCGKSITASNFKEFIDWILQLIDEFKCKCDGDMNISWETIFNLLTNNLDSTEPITLTFDSVTKKIIIGINAGQLADYINNNNIFQGAVTYNNVTKRFTFTGGGGGGNAIEAGPGITITPNSGGTADIVRYRISKYAAPAAGDIIPDYDINIYTIEISQDKNITLDASTLVLDKHDGQRGIYRIKNIASVGTWLSVFPQELTRAVAVGFDIDPSNNKYKEIPDGNVLECEAYMFKDSAGNLCIRFIYLRTYIDSTGEITDFNGYNSIVNIERVMANALSRHEVLLNP